LATPCDDERLAVRFVERFVVANPIELELFPLELAYAGFG